MKTILKIVGIFALFVHIVFAGDTEKFQELLTTNAPDDQIEKFLNDKKASFKVFADTRMKHFIDKKWQYEDDDSYTYALLEAAKKGRAYVIALLESLGADQDVVDSKGRTKSDCLDEFCRQQVGQGTLDESDTSSEYEELELGDRADQNPSFDEEDFETEYQRKLREQELHRQQQEEIRRQQEEIRRRRKKTSKSRPTYNYYRTTGTGGAASAFDDDPFFVRRGGDFMSLNEMLRQVFEGLNTDRSAPRATYFVFEDNDWAERVFSSSGFFGQERDPRFKTFEDDGARFEQFPINDDDYPIAGTKYTKKQLKAAFEVLGLNYDEDKDAFEKAKKCYRKLAFKYHPDKNPGDKKAEETFKEVSCAFELIDDFNKTKY